LWGDDRALLPQPLRHVTARTLVLQDMQITSSGRIVANTPSYSILSDNPTVRLVNGQLQPVLDMRPGQTELWRIANEGAEIFYDLRLPGSVFTIVGRDGCPVFTSDQGGDPLPPARRAMGRPGHGRHPPRPHLARDPCRTALARRGIATRRPSSCKSAWPGGLSVPAPCPSAPCPPPPASLATAHIAANRVIRLSENAAGTKMYINGKQFDPDSSVFSTPAVLGTTERWTILNETGEIHPFHTHTDHFRVMSVNGVKQPYAGEQDIVPVPTGRHGKPGEVVIRIRFTDFTGKVMFHCHIAAHEDAGMMSYVNVIGAAPARPSTRK